MVESQNSHKVRRETADPFEILRNLEFCREQTIGISVALISSDSTHFSEIGLCPIDDFWWNLRILIRSEGKLSIGLKSSTTLSVLARKLSVFA